jgi:hypothetical protein
MMGTMPKSDSHPENPALEDIFQNGTINTTVINNITSQ